MARISVALGTLNGAAYLAEQLESLARQRHLPFELQVGDDGSTDETLDIVAAFRSRAPFPVHVHRNEGNLGFGENFMRTALRCSGEWIAFCDQDDAWLPHKLERCAAIIDSGQHEDLCLVAHNAMIAGPALEEIGPADDWPAQAVYPRLTLHPGWMTSGFRIVFRRALIERIPSSNRQMPWWPGYEDAHDAWVPLIATAVGIVVILGEPLALYRRHAANTSRLWRPDRSTLAQALGAAVRDNSERYVNLAADVGAMAGVLGKRAALTGDRRFAGLLKDASDKFADYSNRLEARAEVYRSRSVSARLDAVVQLLRRGAYLGSKRWRFGAKGLAKDLAYALVSVGRSNRTAR